MAVRLNVVFVECLEYMKYWGLEKYLLTLKILVKLTEVYGLAIMSTVYKKQFYLVSFDIHIL